jgi:hypothetical protein
MTKIREAGEFDKGGEEASASEIKNHWHSCLDHVRQTGRAIVTRPVDESAIAALRRPGIQLQALSPEVAIGSTRLPGELHGDPADRILIAGVRVDGAALVTCDRAILEYSRGGAVAVVDARRRAAGMEG